MVSSKKRRNERKVRMKIFHSKIKFIDEITLYVDGSSIGNPGQSAIGVVIYDQHWNEVERHKQAIGRSTCNQAEYEAVIIGLDLAAKHTRKKVICCLDSDLVEGQVTGRYRLKDTKLRNLFHEVKDKERAFEEVVYCKIRKKDQRLKIAHKIAHDAINGR